MEILKDFATTLRALRTTSPTFRETCSRLTALAAELEAEQRENVVSLLISQVSTSKEEDVKLAAWRVLDQIVTVVGRGYLPGFGEHLPHLARYSLPPTPEYSSVVYGWELKRLFPRETIESIRKGLESGFGKKLEEFSKSEAPAAAGPRAPQPTEAPPAHGWKEHVSADGKKYYHNARTGESVWERPAEMDAVPQPSPAAPRPPVAPVAAAVGSAGAWQELLHSSGRRYYFNAVTQERTWQRPPEMDGPAAGQPGPPATAAAAAAPVSPTPTTAAPTPAPQDVWVEGVSPQGVKYYFNKVTKVSTWDRPAELDRPPPPPKPEAPAAPSVWQECTAPSGDKYWYNPVTKVSTWERPAELAAAAAPPAVPAAVAPTAPQTPAAMVAAAPTTAPAPSAAALAKASMWQEARSPDGIPYWYNRETKVSTWQEPPEVAAVRGTPATAWQEGVSPQGIKYWYNRDTKVSTWERPPELGPEPVATPTPVSAAQPAPIAQPAVYAQQPASPIPTAQPDATPDPKRRRVDAPPAAVEPAAALAAMQPFAQPVGPVPLHAHIPPGVPMQGPPMHAHLNPYAAHQHMAHLAANGYAAHAHYLWPMPPGAAMYPPPMPMGPPSPHPHHHHHQHFFRGPPGPPHHHHHHQHQHHHHQHQFPPHMAHQHHHHHQHLPPGPVPATAPPNQTRPPFAGPGQPSPRGPPTPTPTPTAAAATPPAQAAPEGPDLGPRSPIEPKTGMHIVNPRDIYYTQATIRSTFQDGRPLAETLRQLEKAEIPMTAVPNIRVVWYRGRYWTLDNRRLWVFQRLNRPIKVIYCQKEEVGEEFYTKLSTFTGGRNVLIRDSDSIFPTEMRAEGRLDEAGVLAAMNSLLPKIRAALGHPEFAVDRVLGWRCSPSGKGELYVAQCRLSLPCPGGPPIIKRAEVQFYQTELQQSLLTKIHSLEDDGSAVVKPAAPGVAAGQAEAEANGVEGAMPAESEATAPASAVDAVEQAAP